MHVQTQWEEGPMSYRRGAWAAPPAAAVRAARGAGRAGGGSPPARPGAGCGGGGRVRAADGGLPLGWPQELTAEVEEALGREQAGPQEGLPRADWERVLAAHRAAAESDPAALRRLGPASCPRPGRGAHSGAGAAPIPRASHRLPGHRRVAPPPERGGLGLPQSGARPLLGCFQRSPVVIADGARLCQRFGSCCCASRS